MRRIHWPWPLGVALLAFVLAFVIARPLGAQPKSLELMHPGTLVWCGDQEGGGPYVYPADDDPRRVVGFEVEIADALAEHLRLQASFFQAQWDKLPAMLGSRNCDIVLNGYEMRQEWLEVMAATVPYYVYGLQLLARKDGNVRSWQDLTGPGPLRRVGVLVGTAADAYLTTGRFVGSIAAVEYDGSTDAMREVETKKLDATLQDTPIAIFYRSRFPLLVPIEAPVARGYYVAYVRRDQPALLRALNQSLTLMIANGHLERILRKYSIWDDAQRELMTIAAAGKFYGVDVPESLSAPAAPATGAPAPSASPDSLVGPSERKHGLAVVTSYGGILLQSAGLTVVLSCLSFPLAVALGLAIAIGRMYGPPWLRPLLVAYVEFLRGTPLMLQLYFVFFFLPEVGVNVPAFWTAIVGLSVNYSAYESEIYRAGLASVAPGQMEAALSLGMGRALALRRIILPQAARVALPPMVNDFIALFKDTSVCSVITLVELTKRFSILSQSTQGTFELMLMTGLLYLAMSYPLSAVAQRLERHLAGAST